MFNKIKASFTLSEVLITLMILGVIAVITLPGLIKNIQDKYSVTQVKSAYSLLHRAIGSAVSENGSLDSWNWGEDNSNYFLDVMSKYLNLAKTCKAERLYAKNDCIPDSITHLDGSDGNWIRNLMFADGRALLNNGMSLAFNISHPHGWDNVWVGHINYIGEVLVDINGKQSPNRLGYDIFVFSIGENGLINTLTKYNGLWWEFQSNYCAMGASEHPGLSCSVWVINHNNMDYKYRDVRSEW